VSDTQTQPQEAGTADVRETVDPQDLKVSQTPG